MGLVKILRSKFQIAKTVPFDNSTTDYVSENVQDVIEEIADQTFESVSEFESFYSSTLNSTTSNGWVTSFQNETEEKSGGRYIILHTAQVGQSDKEKQIGHRVQWRENATGTWIDLIDIRDAVSRDDAFQVRTGFNEVVLSADATIEVRIQFGQTDDGGTGRIKNEGFTVWKVAE